MATQPPSVIEFVAATSRPRQIAGKAMTLAAMTWRLPKFPTLLLLLVLVIPGIFADVIAPYDPLEAPGGIRGRFQPPVFAGGSWDHVLGTDKAGRDVLSRILHGSRVSIMISIIGIAIAGTVAARQPGREPLRCLTRREGNASSGQCLQASAS